MALPADSMMSGPEQTLSQEASESAEDCRMREAAMDCVLEAIGEGILVVDPAGSLVFGNQAARRLLPIGAGGVPVQEWPETYGLYLPDACTLWPAEQLPLARALRGETVRETEMFLRHAEAPQGVWVTAAAMPLRDRTGAERGAVMVLRDITEARRAQEALRQERDWTRTIIDTIGVLVVVLDAEGRVVNLNRACELTTGYAFEEVIGRPIWEMFLLPEEAEGVRQVFERLRRGETPGSHENHWVTRTGERRLIVWSHTALLDSEGQIRYVLKTGIDVTERREAERRIHELNDTLRALLEASPLAIWALDLEGRVEFWNPAAERIFGWAAAEVLGRRLPLGVEDQPEELHTLLEAFQSGQVLKGVELRQRRKEGPPVEISLWLVPLRDQTGGLRAVLGVAADITERRRLEEQFRQAQRMEAVGRLAGGAAHDFNNLLTVISGYGQMLWEGLRPEDTLRGAAAEILKAAGSAARLAGQLLILSRKQSVRPRLLDVNEVVAGAEQMLRRVVGEDVELISVLSSEPVRVRADALHLEQVIMNLVVNAREAMPEGGRIVIETAPVFLDEGYAQTHLGAKPGRHVMLAVSDTGKGMDSDTLRQAFEPFFTTKEKGTGLGLSTVYGIVRQHGGHIWAYSEPGRGATFKIYLPASVEAVECADPQIGAPAARGGVETVLLAEDEPDLRKLIVEVLRGAGYTVLAASDPEEALRICREHHGQIDLLLTDVVIPRMTGPALAERVLDLRPSLKVLYMSGYGDRAIVQNGILARGAAFLEKPFTKQTLLRNLREALDAP